MTTDTNGTSGANAPIQDHRQKPRGVMPRQLQTWLMVAIAAVILLIILITGHPQPTGAPQASQRPAQAALPPSDRIRVYQQQLKDDEARLQHLQAQEAAAVGEAVAPWPTAAPPAPAAIDPTADEQRRREYQSLFADNVALSRRAGGQQPTGEAGQRRTGAATSAMLSPESLAALAVLTQAQAANSVRSGGPQAAPPSTADGQPKPVSSVSQPSATPAKVRA